eukprot:CAMPEP_0175120196 /NCGR_PEP_ID=MMETSP0087-20121206/487_1 /TAXON_ID=136419 /ORGANISM="Unknown Unknown, Strain D1" /LENGTH=493 /DNA_ID=CAMNT_0016401617 /DNA_START=525 /DNA_END=2003 /DNA_ORIENTATION=-
MASKWKVDICFPTFLPFKSSVHADAPVSRRKDALTYGLVEIERIDDHCNETYKFSSDAEFVSRMRQAYGPDSFEVQISGPELQTCWVQHRGGCKYECQFAITFPGRYRLVVMNYHENYAGVHEDLDPPGVRDTGSWGALNFDKLLGDSTFLDLPPSFAAVDLAVQKDVAAAVNHASAQGQSDLPRLAAKLTEGRKKAPKCSTGSDVTAGRWVHNKAQASSDSKSFEVEYFASPKDMVRKHTCAAFPWWLDARQFTWVPDNCRLSPLLGTDTDGAEKELGVSLVNRSLSFWGDSHMRHLFNSFMKMFCGVPLAAQKGYFGYVKQCHDFRNKTEGVCSGSYFCYLNNKIFGPDWWDYGQFEEDAELFGFEELFLFVGYGVHPFARHTFTQKMYLTSVDKCVQDFLALKFRLHNATERKLHMIWTGIPAPGVRNDHFVRDFHDWQTAHRFYSGHTYALRAFRDAGFQALDIFHAALPHATATDDCMHLQTFLYDLW